MDEHTLNMEAFTASLTEDQLDTCESDEKQLAEIFSAGWSEANAVRFARAAFHARRVEPGATVEGLFETALKIGLSYIDDDFVARALKSREGEGRRNGAAAKKRDRKRVRGV